jgi:hypothetical protein
MPMSIATSTSHGTPQRLGALLVLALLGLGHPMLGVAAPTGAPPPGMARIWIYRTYEPYVTQATPYIRINGAVVGVSQLGAAFYRDVPPGLYTVIVDSQGSDINQFARVALVAGQSVCIKVDASNWWAGACRNCEIDTFYTRIVSPQLAQAELPGVPVCTGG